MRIAGFLTLIAVLSGNAWCAENSSLSSVMDQARGVDIGAAANPASSPVKDWTVMAFLNGNSNLEDAIQEYDISGLESVGSTGRVSVVAEMAYKSRKINQRILLKKDSSVVLMETPSQNMGDYKHLADFILWAKANYPAKRYMLLVEGHGSGWADYHGGNAPVPTKGMSYDSVFNSLLSTADFPKAFDIAGKVDVLVLKSCLMGSAEALYEARNAADMTVASEEILSTLALDYTALLGYLNQTPDTSLPDLGRYFIRSYSDQFQNNMSYEYLGQTLVAANMKSFDKLPSEINAFVAALEKNNEGEAVLYAQKNALNFQPSYADLGDFAVLVASQSANPETKAACARLLSFIRNELAFAAAGFHKNFDGQEYSRATGFSVQIEPPASAQSVSSYEDLALVKATGWREFIQKYYR